MPALLATFTFLAATTFGLSSCALRTGRQGERKAGAPEARELFDEIMSGEAQDRVLHVPGEDEPITFGSEFEYVFGSATKALAAAMADLPLPSDITTEAIEGGRFSPEQLKQAFILAQSIHELEGRILNYVTPSAEAIEACLAQVTDPSAFLVAVQQALKKTLVENHSEAGTSHQISEHVAPTQASETESIDIDLAAVNAAPEQTFAYWMARSRQDPLRYTTPTYGNRTKSTSFGRPLAILPPERAHALLSYAHSGLVDNRGTQVMLFPSRFVGSAKAAAPGEHRGGERVCDALLQAGAFLPIPGESERWLDEHGFSVEGAAMNQFHEMHLRAQNTLRALRDGTHFLREGFLEGLVSPLPAQVGTHLWLVAPIAAEDAQRTGIESLTRIVQVLVGHRNILRDTTWLAAHLRREHFLFPRHDDELRFGPRWATDTTHSGRGIIRLHLNPFSPSGQSQYGNAGRSLGYAHMGIEIRDSDLSESPGTQRDTLEAPEKRNAMSEIVFAVYLARLATGYFDDLIDAHGGAWSVSPQLVGRHATPEANYLARIADELSLPTDQVSVSRVEDFLRSLNRLPNKAPPQSIQIFAQPFADWQALPCPMAPALRARLLSARRNWFRNMELILTRTTANTDSAYPNAAVEALATFALDVDQERPGLEETLLACIIPHASQSTPCKPHQ